MSELQEKSVKIIFQDKEPVGFFMQNGTLKIYIVKEATYSDVDDLFAVKQNNV